MPTKNSYYQKVSIGKLKMADVREASILLRRAIEESRYYTAKDKKKEIADHSVKNLKILLKEKNRVFRVAKVDGKIAGIVEGFLPPTFGRPALFWITWIIIDKRYRRRRIGSLLMSSFEKGADRRWQKIQGRVRVSNYASNRMFKKLGYKIIKVHRRRIKKNNAYKWERIL